MAVELNAISDGTFTLQETEDKNRFYFYRNDGEVLTDIEREPMDLYQAYIAHQMMSGEIKDVVMNNIDFEISDDEKIIRLTISEITKQPVQMSSQKPSFFKRVFHKIFG